MSKTLTPALDFSQMLDALATGVAGETRMAAHRRYAAAGLPGAKDEEWKYTSLRLLGESKFEMDPAALPLAEILGSLPGLAPENRLVFVNGRFIPNLSSAALPSGVRLFPLADGIPDDLGTITSLEGKLGSTNDQRFADLNLALFEDGAWLEVEAGATIEEPIQVVFLTSPGAMSFPRLFARMGASSSATIVEYHVGIGAYATFPVAEFEVGEQAVLDHVRIQLDSLEAFHIATLAGSQGSASTLTTTNVQFGAKIGRIDANIWVGGEHAETWLNGAYVGRGEQHLDNHTRIDHAVPNCHSFEVYKGILGDRATGVFNGKIFVYADAQKTDAKQTNQALLLSPTATVNTKPQLEIFADDVKCTHGATVGQLREDAMFYLRSRGIPVHEARSLLVYAFVAEVLERISDERLRDALETRLFAKLAPDSQE
jgi:Fe-S cluster assembly protein SufD